MQQIDPKEFAAAYEELKTGLDSITEIVRKIKAMTVKKETDGNVWEGLERIDFIAGILGATLRGMAF